MAIGCLVDWWIADHLTQRIQRSACTHGAGTVIPQYRKFNDNS